MKTVPYFISLGSKSRALALLVFFMLSGIVTSLASISSLSVSYTSDGKVKITTVVSTSWYCLDRRTPDFRISVDGSEIEWHGHYLVGGNTSSQTFVDYYSGPAAGASLEIKASAYKPNVGCGGDGSFINSISKTLEIPQAMSNLSLSNSSGDISVTWNPGGIVTTGYKLTSYQYNGSDWVEMKTVDLSGDARSYTINDAVQWSSYRVKLVQSFPGWVRTRTATIQTGQPASWIFSNLRIDESSDKFTVRWNDPTATSALDAATDEWYFKIERRSRFLGQSSTSYSGWTTLKSDIGIGNNNSSGQFYEDTGVEDCSVYQYRLTQYIQDGSVTRAIGSSQIVELRKPSEERNPLKPKVPTNFQVVNTDACTDDKVTLSWNLEHNHPCMELWFRIVRYQLDANGNLVNGTRKQLAERKDNATYGGGWETNISNSGNTFEFTDTGIDDEGNPAPLEKGKRYGYWLSARTRINANDILYGLYVTEADGHVTYFVGGPIDPPTGSPSATLVDGDNGYVTLNWTDEWPNEEEFIVKRYIKGTSTLDATFTLPDGSTSYTDRVSDDNGPQICTDYEYEILAKNDCEEQSLGVIDTDGSGPLKITKNIDDTFLPGALKADKGYHQNFVHLEWEIANNTSSIKTLKIFRKPVNSAGDSVLVASIDGGLRSYDDYEVPANTLCHYYLVGEADCGIDPLVSNVVSDIGFRVPFGLVTGHVDFEGGVAVKNAKILAENSSGVNLNKSLKFDGVNDYARINNNYDETNESGDLMFLFDDHGRTIEFWAKVDAFNGGGLFSIGDTESLSKGLLALNVPSDNTSKNWSVEIGSDLDLIANLNINTGEWHHFAITYANDTLSLYVDGADTTASGQLMEWQIAGGLNTGLEETSGEYNYNHWLALGRSVTTDGSGIKYTKFNLDEFRAWSYARTQEEIKKDMSGFLVGNESGLELYYRVDEGFGDRLYDASYAGNVYHGRHAVLNNGLTTGWSSAVPSSDQLGSNAYTDSEGNYVINYMRYSGSGNQFNLVPFIANHKFRPQNKLIYVGENTPVHNNQDFTDISAFEVTGTALYGKDVNGNGKIDIDEKFCPAEGLFVTIDGQIAVKDGQAITTDANGEFNINVPIGDHFISLQKTGHTFAVGRFPEEGKWDFQQPLNGLEFIDNTLLTVVGKVVGGKEEGDKITGLGRTVNNIGTATLVFSSKLGCYEDTVRTDSTTGEYSINLLPLEYNVQGGADLDPEVFIASNPTIKFPVQSIDLKTNRPLQVVTDSVFTENDELIRVDSVIYHLKQDYVHRNPHTLAVIDPRTDDPFSTGQENIAYKDRDGNIDSIPADMFDYPVFNKGTAYSALIKVTEIYENRDNPENIIKDTIPATDAVITISNGLAVNANLSFELKNTDGDSLYVFVGGDPNFTTNPGEPEKDFVKRFEVISEVGNQSDSYSLEGYVLGAKPEGNSFTTQGPDVVEHILRDPPGTNSFASIAKGQTLTSTFEWAVIGNLDVSTQWAVHAGADFTVGLGLGVRTDIKGVVTNTTEVNASLGGGESYSQTINVEETISTNSGLERGNVGSISDLFIGKSYNMDFGVAQYLEVLPAENCGSSIPCKNDSSTSVTGKKYKIGRRTGFFVSPSGYNTYFIYSQRHIKEQLIPDLMDLRNQLLLTDSHYELVFTDQNDPKFGTNNDDPAWGALASTSTPLEREVEDFTGPSYNFSKVFAPDEPQVDSVRWYNQQIRLWKEALKLNEQQKMNAEDPQTPPVVGGIGSLEGEVDRSGELIDQEVDALQENISFSSGASFTRSVSLSNNVSWNLAYEVSLSNTVAANFSAKVNGAGAETEHSITLGVTTNGTTSTSQDRSITYEFTLEDENTGDFYSVDVLDGGSQNGPIFKVRGGETSCPHEGEEKTEYYKKGSILQKATVAKEKPTITISPAKLVAVPSDQEAVFTVLLGNENPDEGRYYTLYIDPASNPDGAVITLDGMNPNQEFWIPAGSVVSKTLVVRKSPNQNEFNNIKIGLKSACDVHISKETSFSVSFLPTCSKSEIVSPLNNWVLNNNFNDTLPMRFGEYDINFETFEKLIFRYKPSTSATWIEQAVFYNKESAGEDTLLISRNLPYTNYEWNVASLNDGSYDIQIVTVCGNGTQRESEVLTGTIDRVSPHNFGNPTPADGVLSPDDEISIRYNETINSELINKALNIDIRGVLNGADIEHFTSLYFDGDDNVEIPAMTLSGRSFTTEFWIKRDGLGENTLINHDNEMAIGFNADNNVYLSISGETVTTGSTVADSDWHHIAVTFDYTTHQAQIVIDGTSEVTSTLNADIESSTLKTTVGESFAGNIHELRIWGDVRQLTEVRLNYLKTLNGTEPGLLGYWPMDEGHGSMAMDKTGRRQATVNATWSFAQEGRSIALDGTDDFFRVHAGALGFSPEADFTVSMWFKGNNGTNQTLWSNGRIENDNDLQPTAWALQSNAEGILYLKNNGTFLRVGSESYFDGSWHHVAVVVNRLGNTNVFIDGDLVATIDSDNFSAFAGSNLSFGAYQRNNGAIETIDQYFAGSIDEIRVWNTARKQDQIQRDMHFKLRGDELGLMAYYPFEDYTLDISGLYVLAETIEDKSEKADIGLAPYASALEGGAAYTNETPAVKIERPVEKVNFTYSVNGDHLIITPIDDPGRIENVTLDITVRGIQDLNGNSMESAVTWIAYVNKNQVTWSEDRYTETLELGEGQVFTSEVVNVGGEAKSFSIEGLPVWLHASPQSATIAPQSRMTITFTISEGMNIGSYEENIALSTDFGSSEILALNVSVTGNTPEWSVNPEDFEYSMGVVGQVKIDNIFSTDEKDLVAAFVDEELRGVSPVKYLTSSGNYRVYLNIYSNTAQGENISFRVWDASKGVVLEDITPEMVFVNNALEGTQADPVIISGGGVQLSSIDLKPGWNWISFNVNPVNPDVDSVLAKLTVSNNDLIKSQESFDQYMHTVGWVGSLSDAGGVKFKESYKIRVEKESKLLVKGSIIDLANSPVNVKAGWNWIGYLGQNTIPVNEAMATYNAVEGDVVKGQRTFAIFDPQEGWIGSLVNMEAGRGYMLKATNEGQIIYPERNSFSGLRTAAPGVETVDGNGYESNMNIIAELVGDNSGMYKNYWLVARDKNGNTLGGIESLNDLYYLTVQGNASVGAVNFFLKNKQTGEELALEEAVSFNSDALIGYPESYKLHVRSSAEEHYEKTVSVYPNPLGSQKLLNLQYSSPEAGSLKIEIYSVVGVKVAEVFNGGIAKGMHSFSFDTGNLEKGIYTIIVNKDGEKDILKFIK